MFLKGIKELINTNIYYNYIIIKRKNYLYLLKLKIIHFNLLSHCVFMYFIYIY